MAATLYNWSSNQWEDVPDTDVTDAVAKGTHSFNEDHTIPVIAPNGHLGDIPATHAQDAFNAGFRFATHDDALAWQERGIEASNSRIYDSGIAPIDGVDASSPQAEAMMQGLGTGIVPGFNWAVRKAAGLAGGDEAAIEEGQKQLAERNPGHTLAGNLLGSVIGVPGKLGGLVAGKATAAIGGLGDVLAESGALSTTAARIASTIASRTAGTAIEAGFFNAADQINEAAIGSPTEVASNLAATTAASLIFGGTVGAVVGGVEASAPAIKKLVTGTLGVINRATNKGAEFIAQNGVLQPALTITGKRALLDATGTAIGDMEGRMVEKYGGGTAALQTARDTLQGGEQKFIDESAQLHSDVMGDLAGEPKKIIEDIRSTVAAAGGDMGKAIQDLHVQTGAKAEELSRALAPGAEMQPGVMHDEVANYTKNIEGRLVKAGDKNSTALGTSLSGVNNAAERAAGVEVTMTADQTNAQMGASREFANARVLRDRAEAALPKLPEHVQVIAQEYIDSLTKLMYEHPLYGEMQAAVDHGNNTVQAFSDALGKNIGVAGNAPKDQILMRMVRNPAFREQMNVLMQDVPGLHAKLNGFLGSVDDLGLQLEKATNINETLKAAKASGRVLTVDDLQQMAEVLGKDSVTPKLDRIREIQDFLTAKDESPVSKFVRVMSATGQDVSAATLKALDHSDAVDAMAQIRGPAVDSNHLSNILQKVMKNKVKAVVGGAVGGFLGRDSDVGGMVGAGAGAAAALGMGAVLNPARVIDTLTSLQRMNNTATKMMDLGLKAAVDGISEGTAARVFTNFAVYKASKETYTDHVAHVDDLAKSPSAMADEFNRRVGQIPGAPQISQALAAQYARGVTFLASKAQHDPLAQYSIGNHSPWAPNDFMLSRWSQYVNAVENPMTVLKSVSENSVTPEQIEALKAVHPAVYDRLKSGVMDAIMEPSNKIPYQARVQIGTLLELASDPTLRPEFVGAMQDKYERENQGKKQQQTAAGNPTAPAKPGSSKPSIASQPSETDRVTYKQ